MGVVSSHHGFGNLLCSHRQLIQSQIFSVFCGVGLGAGDKVRNSAGAWEHLAGTETTGEGVSAVVFLVV